MTKFGYLLKFQAKQSNSKESTNCKQKHLKAF